MSIVISLILMCVVAVILFIAVDYVPLKDARLKNITKCLILVFLAIAILTRFTGFG